MKSILTSTLLLCITYSAFTQNFNGDPEEIEKILKNTTKFSVYVMTADYENIAASYTSDAKIFPNRSKILEGDAIKNYWVLPEGSKTKYHKIFQSEVRVIGDTAYDYGYYEGISLNPQGIESKWTGKYVIIWKKENGDWKMYLDIWNSAPPLVK